MNSVTSGEETDTHLSVTEAIDILQYKDSSQLTEWQSIAEKIVRRTTQLKLTYTTNVFLPVTFLCRNACSYCNYKKSRVPKGEEYINPENVSMMLKKAQIHGVSEFLITMGEKPETVFPEAEKWLLKHNFNSTIEYTHSIAKTALSKGLLPHINAGSLNTAELAYLKQVSASMGVMLENVSSRLKQEGMPHHQSPDKDPKKRLTTLTAAGKLKIPFTTGILVGIGETPEEIVASLFTLRNLHLKYNHIQEVIIQPYIAGNNDNSQYIDEFQYQYLKRVVIIARNILPASIAIQTPPNLVHGFEHDVIQAGITDWGGISPITIDYINPKNEWPAISFLQKLASDNGFSLVERLPIYPQFVKLPWLSPPVYEVIQNYKLVSENGLRKH